MNYLLWNAWLNFQGGYQNNEQKMPMRRALSIFFALLWHISGENLWRIFSDPTRSLWEPLKIFKILVNIFKDLSFSCQNLQSSCQDLQGSFIFLPRSLRIFHFPVKTFEDLDKNFKDPLKIFENSLRIFQILVKIFEDLSFSCQYLQGSFTFQPRSWTMPRYANKRWRQVGTPCIFPSR